MKSYNQQYNYASADSLSVLVATRVRERMFARFIAVFKPDTEDTILDIGVTAEQSYASSNYFESLYPFKNRIVACGIDDAHFLEEKYPGVAFCFADALNLPFSDYAFDFVHCSAVWEHIGSRENQQKMLAEGLRVARRGIMLTTPNRWFPIEFHCQLPLIHWLPKPAFRAILRRTKYDDLANESVLNLLTPSEVEAMCSAAHQEWTFQLEFARLFGLPSNILLFGRRRS